MKIDRNMKQQVKERRMQWWKLVRDKIKDMPHKSYQGAKFEKVEWLELFCFARVKIDEEMLELSEAIKGWKRQEIIGELAVSYFYLFS